MFAIRRWLHTEYGDKVLTVQKDTKYACSVTMRRVCATIVAMEKQYVLHILSVCL
jgi:hypothetical protein